MTAVDTRSVLADLRSARRHHRVEQRDRVEALYHVYLAALVSIVIVLFVSSAVGDRTVDASGLADLRANGPAIVGFIAALALAIGLRSGSRGGPMALEAAEVRHVLLAPIDRRRALLGSAERLMRYGAFIGALVGAVAGELAAKRLPHGAPRWIAAGAVTGMVIAVAAFGVAFLAGGRRVPRPAATALGALLVAWALADVVKDVWSPFRIVGHLALWPLDVHLVDLTAVAGAIALAGLGLAALGGYRLEDAERRTGLVGQIRFAATMQDLRTVIVLRRQLSLEQLRRRPWFGGDHTPKRRPRRAITSVIRRDVQGLRRFPVTRITRMAILAAIAGVSLREVWHGTTPLALVAGAALLIAALDAAEPLAQEVDHPDRTDLVPVERGLLFARHLPAVAMTMLFVGLIGLGVAVAFEHTMAALVLGAITLLPASLAAAAAGVVSVALPPPEPFKDGQLVPPEFAGLKIIFRAAGPLLLALAGTAPVIAAARAVRAAKPIDPYVAAGAAAGFLVLPIAFTVAWVRFREPARVWWKSFLAEGQKAAADRRKAPIR